MFFYAINLFEIGILLVQTIYNELGIQFERRGIMGMGVELHIILAYAFGLILLYILGYLLLIPIKWILKFIYNGILGGILLLVINIVGGFFGFHIAMNIITALIAGVLGVPGVVLLVVVKYLLK